MRIKPGENVKKRDWKVYLELFEQNRRNARGTKIQKAARNPRKVLLAFVLSSIAVCLKRQFNISTDTFWGDKMNVVIPEVVSLGIYRFGLAEEGLTRLLLEYLKPGATFVDIGAHFGYFTLLGSSVVGTKGQVHSFEPTPTTFGILQSNVASTGRNNIFLNNCAVFSTRGAMVFYDCGIAHSAYNSLVDVSGWIDKRIRKIKPRKIEVSAISLDEYVYKNQISPTFIKIDAENAEYEILTGMSKTINEFRPTISIEVGDTNVSCSKSSGDRVKYLIERKYNAYEYRDGRIVDHRLLERYKYDNILFLPK